MLDSGFQIQHCPPNFEEILTMLIMSEKALATEDVIGLLKLVRSTAYS